MAVDQQEFHKMGTGFTGLSGREEERAIPALHPRHLVNPVEKNQTDAWIVRVQGQEYGPVDLDELREWKREGRLIRENEIRELGSERWIPASELPELFADETIARPPELPVVRQETTLGQVLLRTWQVYRQGFWHFLGLTALAVVPSVCAQLSSAGAGTPATSELDFRAALAGLFNFSMLMASLFAWPLYIAGIQILTAEIAQGRSRALAEVIPQALKSWPRVAGLCLLVYGAFILLTGLAFFILLMVVAGPPSLVLIFVALALLLVQVWMFGRVLVNVLFWQQPAVLENTGVVESLKRSKELARSRSELPWWRRPWWRGVVVASIWSLFAFALSVGPEWSTMTSYFHSLTTMQDPQAILQSMSAASKSADFSPVSLCLTLLQAILRPLLGIAFVLIYLDIMGSKILPPNE
jgi:GYF domain 2